MNWPAAIERTRRQGGPTGHPGAPSVAVASADVEEMATLFQAACEAVGGAVHHIQDVQAIATFVAALCDAEGRRTVLAWDETQLPLAGLTHAMATAGLALVDPTLPPDGPARADALTRLDTAAVGVTGALALLADTGSVVVAAGRGRPRLASLLPPVHVALVTRAMLVPSLGALFAHNPRLPGDAANLVAITGPSRTADIEMTLTRGVHGPKTLHVVFVS
jgi:L-lactate dehydrogenase complex protein LldG